MTKISVVRIPADHTQALHLIPINSDALTVVGDIQYMLAVDEADNVLTTLLCRPTTSTPGLQAYHDPCSRYPNIRATRLAFGCGLFLIRFYGDVILMRCSIGTTNAIAVTSGQGVLELTVRDVESATSSADWRRTTFHELEISNPYIPDWLSNAAWSNYHDEPVLQRFSRLVNTHNKKHDDDDDNDHDTKSDENIIITQKSLNETSPGDCLTILSDSNVTMETCRTSPTNPHFAVTRETLCIHCRRPAATLCAQCEGVYLCPLPRLCHQQGWTHECLCPNYKLYARRRQELSFNDDPVMGTWEWVKKLTKRPLQLSDAPYEDFLLGLGVHKHDSSWWRTEFSGWAGGQSDSAIGIDITIRRKYQTGFYPIVDGIPPERPLSLSERSSWKQHNELGFPRIRSWTEYFHLRGISQGESVAPLLLTYPLTLYYAIVEYAQVPCIVARMLRRPLRIHIVGIEKELNFLDLFQEVAFLLPQDMPLDLCFIVRDDMLPPMVRSSVDKRRYSIRLGDGTTRIRIFTGTYGGSLDPDFDLGGAPDVVFAFNAGLYAYESWRSVIEYLDKKGFPAIFTDYNEFSGLNCSSLGKAKCRESLCINPFRQPRSMPVYSMNLPQFTNGFIYVMNEQVLPVD